MFNDHYRVVKIQHDNEILYSIDIYEKLPSNLNCKDKISGGPVTLCYVQYKDCTMVFSLTGDRAELISLRLKTKAKEDPAKGSLDKAREYCYMLVREWMKNWVKESVD